MVNKMSIYKYQNWAEINIFYINIVPFNFILIQMEQYWQEFQQNSRDQYLFASNQFENQQVDMSFLSRKPQGSLALMAHNIVQDKAQESGRSRIFYEDSDNQEQEMSLSPNSTGQNIKDSLNISTLDMPSNITIQQKSSFQGLEDKIDEQTSRIKLKRNGDPQVNACPSKNFIAFLWKKIVKFMKEAKCKQFFSKFKGEKANLNTLNQLFLDKQIYRVLELAFQNKIFWRDIINSSIDRHKKKQYIRFLRNVYKGFLNKIIHFLV